MIASDRLQSSLALGSLIVLSSDEIDLSSTGDKVWGSDWPVRPGLALLPSVMRLVGTTLTGAQVANPQLQVGSNVTRNNIGPTTTIQASNLNASFSVGAIKNWNASLTVNSTQSAINLDGTIPIPFVQTAVTAGQTCKGHIWLLALVVPFYT